jgi:hypothetical protein
MAATTQVQPTAGATLYIGPASDEQPADAAAAAALNWTRIRKTETFGAFGDAAQSVTFDATDDDRRFKAKGTKDAGDWSFTCGFVAADAGQQALMDAVDSEQNFNFKLVMDDEPINGTTPTTFFLYGLVMSARPNPGGANNVVRLEASVGLNGKPLMIPAA